MILSKYRNCSRNRMKRCKNDLKFFCRFLHSAKPCNYTLVIGEKTREFIGFGQFEISEIETRRHGTAYEREVCFRRRLAGEPTSGGYHILKGFSGVYIAAQPYGFHGSVRMNQMHKQCFSRIKMPAFIAFDAVKSGEVSPWKQEIDRGGKTSGA